MARIDQAEIDRIKGETDIVLVLTAKERSKIEKLDYKTAA